VAGVDMAFLPKNFAFTNGTPIRCVQFPTRR
jgi:hypothetical protein